MTIDFDWDNEKAKVNIRKHGVSFTDATTVFDDPLSITLDDTLHSQEEDRFLIIGYSQQQMLLVVAYTYRGNNIRIISARIATRRERKIYEQGN
ncbi:BrnT family toxin [Iningainema tapete]|uniref:BrnT family toxin n=1 Tax=Iningainema tapete BLCC-T55 TaxID=2748662 RepID=A0A8J6XSG1_9CYAN|nr:BrnT family toxin [Iningainema tapete]MBD2778722.1 BrnT family toxin [Iningainema tapete BLCC-T55]